MGNNLCMVDKSTRGYDVEFEKVVSKYLYLISLIIIYNLIAKCDTKLG